MPTTAALAQCKRFASRTCEYSRKLVGLTDRCNRGCRRSQSIFIGDTNDDGAYSAQDAGWISSVVVKPQLGSMLIGWWIPVIIADVTQNGILDGLDASWISRKGLSTGFQTTDTDLPSGSRQVFGGADPTLAIALRVPGRQGQTANVHCEITDSAADCGAWTRPLTMNHQQARLAGRFERDR